MKSTFAKKLVITLIVTAGIILAAQVCAMACTTLYVGGNLTTDGSPLVCRSEDYVNSLAKLAYISPAGEYKGGSLYVGCAAYGAFEWTLSHDSYEFWAFKADNEFDGLCPECGLPGHPSYTEHGTNSYGVTVSATETTSTNSAIIGRMCLDDPSVAIHNNSDWVNDPNINVVASPGIFDVPQRAAAGTFKGDASKGIIDFKATYDNTTRSDARLTNGLNFLNSAYNFSGTAWQQNNSMYTITNVDADDNVVELHTGIVADRVLGPDDAANYYKLASIGNTNNTDTAFFQLYKDGRPFELSTVAWIQMDHGSYNVFVPFYPLLTDSLYEGYEHAVGEATKGVSAANLPAQVASGHNMYYRTSASGNYTVLPLNWEQNYYWTFDALSNYILYSANGGPGPAVTADRLQYALGQLACLQKSIYKEFDGLNAQLAKVSVTSEAARTDATASFADMAQQAHMLALELVKYLSATDSYQLNYVGADTSVGPVKYYAAGYAATVASPDGDFLGWDTNPQATTVVYQAGDTFAINADTTLYAVSPYTLTSIATTTKDFTSMVETAKNSNVWVLTFNVTKAYASGTTDVVTYTVNLNGNNANLDGTYTFGADSGDLAGYTLVYDIKGNGSNIKTFELIQP